MKSEVTTDNSGSFSLVELLAGLVHHMTVADRDLRDLEKDKRGVMFYAVARCLHFVRGLAFHVTGRLQTGSDPLGATLESLGITFLDLIDGRSASMLSEEPVAQRDCWPHSSWIRMAGNVAPDDCGNWSLKLGGLVDDMIVADSMLAKDGRGSALYAVSKLREFVPPLAYDVWGLRAGDALDCLHLELVIVDNRRPSSLLSPSDQSRRASTEDKTCAQRGKRPKGWPIKTQKLRAEVAGSMELLYRHSPKLGLDNAAKEVAKMLIGNPILALTTGEPWRTIKHWRGDIKETGVSDIAIEHYNQFLTLTTDLVRATGGNSADFRRIIRYKLQRLGTS